MKIARPPANEYNDFYGYYINLVTQDDLITALSETSTQLVSLFKSIPAEIEVFRYDVNKWSIKEVLMHIIDFERYLAYKAFVSLRNDHDTVLYHPKREHYIFHAGTENRNLENLADEFRTVREATLSLFLNAGSVQLTLKAKHAGQQHVISARALGFALTGHGVHHMQIIKEKYLQHSKPPVRNKQIR